MMKLTTERALAFIFLLSACAAANGKAFAAEGGNCDSIEQVLEGRLSLDPQLAFIDSRIDEAEADQSSVASLWRPQISTYLRSGVGSNGLAESQLGNQLGLEGRQRIFDFGDARRRARLAEAEISARQAERLETQFSLIEETINIYYDVVRANELIALTATSQSILSRRLGTSEDLLRDNLSTQSDVYALRMELQKEKSDEALARFNREAALERLRILTGTKPVVCDEHNTIDQSSLRPSLLLQAAEFDPAVQVATREVEAAARALEIEKKSRLPIIEIVGRSGYAGSEFDDWDYEDRLSVSVRVPLYAGGQIEAGADKARARKAQAQALLDQEKREALIRVQLLRQNLASLSERLQLIEKAIENSVFERESIQTRIDLEAGTLLNFFEAHRRYVSLERDRIETKRELAVNRALLDVRLQSLEYSL